MSRCEQVAANFEQALAVFREIGDQVLEAQALNGLGDVLFLTGQTGPSRAHHAAALQLVSHVLAP